MAGDIFNYTTLSGLSIPSGGTVWIPTGAAFSVATYSAATLVPNNSLGVVFRTSGISLVFKSGSTIYSFGSSSYSGAA